MTPPTLLSVRYYGTYYAPEFFRGRGWRGWLVRILNAARYALETAVQRLVLADLLARLPDAPPAHRRAAVARFWADVRAERSPGALPASAPPAAPTPQPVRPLSLDQLHARYAGRRYGAPQLVFEDEFEPRGPDDEEV